MDALFHPLVTADERGDLVRQLQRHEKRHGLRIVAASVIPEMHERPGDCRVAGVYVPVRPRNTSRPELHARRVGRFDFVYRELEWSLDHDMAPVLGALQYGEALIRHQGLESLYKVDAPGASVLGLSVAKMAHYLQPESPVRRQTFEAVGKAWTQHTPEILERDNLDMSLCRAALEVLWPIKGGKPRLWDDTAERVVEHWAAHEERLRSTEWQRSPYFLGRRLAADVDVDAVQDALEPLCAAATGVAGADPERCTREVYFSDTGTYGPHRSLRTELLQKIEARIQEREDEAFR